LTNSLTTADEGDVVTVVVRHLDLDGAVVLEFG
jgi:hypothetical protein